MLVTLYLCTYVFLSSEFQLVPLSQGIKSIEFL